MKHTEMGLPRDDPESGHLGSPSWFLVESSSGAVSDLHWVGMRWVRTGEGRPVLKGLAGSEVFVTEVGACWECLRAAGDSAGGLGA